MNEVEGRFQQRVGGYIVAAHLEIRELNGHKKAGINVSHQYTSHRADTIREPTRDRSAATTYFQAVPTAPDPARFQVTYSAGVKQGGKDGESCWRLSRAVVQQVT